MASASALAFIDFSRTVLDELITRHGMDTPSVDPAMAEEFDPHARRVGGDRPLRARVRVDLRAGRRGARVPLRRLRPASSPRATRSAAPASGPPTRELRRPFRVALVNGILAALEREGGGSAALAAELRADWPDDDIR